MQISDERWRRPPTTVCVQKLEWLPFRAVSKYPQYIVWFCHKALVRQIDRQMDRIMTANTVKLCYNVFLGTKNRYITGKVRYNQQGRKRRQRIKQSQIPKSCTNECVTTNIIVQIKQCNRSCWLFPWLRRAGMQTGQHRLSWTARVGKIWPALAATRSDQHPHPDTRRHTDGISVTQSAGTLLTEVNCEECMYIRTSRGPL